MEFPLYRPFSFSQTTYEMFSLNVSGRISWCLYLSIVRADIHAPTKSVSVPASISLLPPVQPRSGVHTYRQNRYRRLQGGQFREWCRAVNMAPMWNRRFYLLCLLHLRRRRRLKRRERECWEHPIVAARTLGCLLYSWWETWIPHLFCPTNTVCSPLIQSESLRGLSKKYPDWNCSSCSHTSHLLQQFLTKHGTAQL